MMAGIPTITVRSIDRDQDEAAEESGIAPRLQLGPGAGLGRRHLGSPSTRQHGARVEREHTGGGWIGR